MNYDFDKLKEAILFNTVEVLPTDEAQIEKEIKNLVDNANQSGEEIRHYIGFEISGQIHLGTGMMTAIKIKKLQDAGVKCAIWLANYHTWLNNKLDGKLETIKKVKDEYFKPIFIKCCEVVGCDIEKIEFLDADQLYFQKNQKGQYFWDYMMKVSRQLTLARVNKSVTVTGKQAGEGIEFGILCYPIMQVADAFFLQSHIVHAGLDQRKCHVLMREVANSMDEDFELSINNQRIKPIAVHHKLLLSLGVTAQSTQNRMTTEITEDLKMSKSKADSAVWVHDSEEEIAKKLKKAYCPIPDSNQNQSQIEETQIYNPVLNWCEFLIYPAGQIINLERPEKFGGNKTYHTFEELKEDYFSGNLHPMDLKSGVAKTLSNWLAPIRHWTSENMYAMETVISALKQK